MLMYDFIIAVISGTKCCSAVSTSLSTWLSLAFVTHSIRFQQPIRPSSAYNDRSLVVYTAVIVNFVVFVWRLFAHTSTCRSWFIICTYAVVDVAITSFMSTGWMSLDSLHATTVTCLDAPLPTTRAEAQPTLPPRSQAPSNDVAPRLVCHKTHSCPVLHVQTCSMPSSFWNINSHNKTHGIDGASRTVLMLLVVASRLRLIATEVPSMLLAPLNAVVTSPVDRSPAYVLEVMQAFPAKTKQGTHALCIESDYGQTQGKQEIGVIAKF